MTEYFLKPGAIPTVFTLFWRVSVAASNVRHFHNQTHGQAGASSMQVYHLQQRRRLSLQHNQICMQKEIGSGLPGLTLSIMGDQLDQQSLHIYSVCLASWLQSQP